MDLDTLNPGQRAAVTASDGVQLVIAGAGTGKTRTLVHRVAWLVEQGIDPRQIVLLTFTRRAAAEMLQRASALVGQRARGVRGGTFHSFAVAALRRHASALGYTRDFTILDSSDASSFVGLVRSSLGLGGKGRRFPQRNTLLKLLSQQINTGRELAALVERAYPQYIDDVEDMARVGQAYTRRKRAQNVMDFDDLLVNLERLLREHERPRMQLSSAARYILVDEYQDTNPLQARISGMLQVAHGNLMVVGDEAQSIYGFRGADVENILRFPELFPAVEVLRLEQNYRSTQPILDLANGVLASATRGFDKTLHSDIAGSDRAQLVRLSDEHDQAHYIVERVLQLREEGVALRDIAVLFRSGFHANELELALGHANVPFRKFGGLQFMEASHVKDVVSLMRLVANPTDGLALYRVLLWFEGLGAKTAAKIVEEVESNGLFDPSARRKRKYGGALAYLAGVLEDARKLAEDPVEMLEELLEYYRPLMARLYEDHHRRHNDLITLQLLAERADDLETLLAELSLEPPAAAEVQPSNDEDEWMTLSTVHSAKGLEWHTVFVLDLVDGHFPSGRSLDDEESLEEERRLLYVAITRAKRQLLLMQPRFVRGRSFGGRCTLLDQIPDLPGHTEQLRWQPGREPLVDKHPDLAAAEQRMSAFLASFDKKR